jgi:hypothetical protein
MDSKVDRVHATCFIRVGISDRPSEKATLPSSSYEPCTVMHATTTATTATSTATSTTKAMSKASTT